MKKVSNIEAEVKELRLLPPKLGRCPKCGAGMSFCHKPNNPNKFETDINDIFCPICWFGSAEI